MMINTVFFYILSAICLITTLFCLFKKDTVSTVAGAVIIFWAFSGFYFMLGAPYLAAVQLMLWGVGISILMMFSVMMTYKKDDEKNGFLFNLKTIATPVICGIFIMLVAPFILYGCRGENTLKIHNISDFAILLYKNNPLGFELTGILLFCAIAGIAAIIVKRGRC